MGRITLALGFAVLAGCGGEGVETPSSRGSLTVSNQGTSALNGIAEDWYGPEAHLFSLDPGEEVRIEFSNASRVKLHAWRSSDGLLLIDDFWDSGELIEGVRVTLYP